MRKSINKITNDIVNEKTAPVRKAKFLAVSLLVFDGTKYSQRIKTKNWISKYKSRNVLKKRNNSFKYLVWNLRL